MLSQIYDRYRRLRNLLCKERLIARLIGSPWGSPDAEEPGLLLIQIDGLPMDQFRHALRSGRMPFLNDFFQREDRSLYPFYPGLPSATPGVQAELMYGVRGAVPAFGFYSREKRKQMEMSDPEDARYIADRLRRTGGRPLLKGGRSYSNIFTGDADDARFCFEQIDRLGRDLNLFALPLLCLFYPLRFLESLGLMLLELVLATGDAIAGIFRHKKAKEELKFIPIRIGICILLRELVRFHTRLSISQGARVIHSNFLGYDEQSHRRGPGSKYAHWVLKGIDRSIEQLIREAEKSSARDYEIVVYSDHGQEHVQSFQKVHNQSLRRCVHKVIEQQFFEDRPPSRERLFPSGIFFSPSPRKQREEHDSPIHVSAVGPLAHVYLDQFPPNTSLETIATALVEKCDVPAAIWKSEDGKCHARNSSGHLRLPEGSIRLFGIDHPFRKETMEDLLHLIDSDLAGDIVVLGYDAQGEKNVSFPLENGAHGGTGPDETHGFLLASRRFLQKKKIPSGPDGKQRFRPSDLREFGFHWLDQRVPDTSGPSLNTPSVSTNESRKVRIVTWNIHSCIGLDRKARTRRIAREISRYEPDVVALQEVDFHRKRTGNVNQPEELAKFIGMNHIFLPLLESGDEKYGIALLSHLSFDIIRSNNLGPLNPDSCHEARGAQLIDLRPSGINLSIVNTHLGLTRSERRRQTAILTGPDWLGSLPDGMETVICGDLNCTSRGETYKTLSQQYFDAQISANNSKPKTTFPTLWPLVRIDHIFVSKGVTVERVLQYRDDRAFIASDHLALAADLTVPYL